MPFKLKKKKFEIGISNKRGRENLNWSLKWETGFQY